jgi:hypothetical protein
MNLARTKQNIFAHHCTRLLTITYYDLNFMKKYCLTDFSDVSYYRKANTPLL